MHIDRDPDFETPTIAIWVMHTWKVPQGIDTIIETNIPTIVIVFTRKKEANDAKVKLVA